MRAAGLSLNNWTNCQRGSGFWREPRLKAINFLRQIDRATPRPTRKMSLQQFLRFARQRLSLPQEMHSCYEAGPFGYTLHRLLLGHGSGGAPARLG